MRNATLSELQGLNRLSVREREVLSLAVSGHIDKEIASRLGVSANTIRTYWSRIRSKVGDLPRTGLAAVYIERSVTERIGNMVPGCEWDADVFIASVGQELRIPLNSIIGFTGIMLMDMVGPISEEQRKQLTMVQQSSKALLALLNDVVDITRLEAGTIETSQARFDIMSIAKEVASHFQAAAQSKGLGISVSGPGRLMIVSDRWRVRQVVSNLVNNAIKFSDKGNVEIDVSAEDDGAWISVSDTGIGIEASDISRLFQPFFQIHREGHPKEGSGLGLYLARRIADVLEGKILVQSCVGKGSTFAFWLPAKPWRVPE